MEFKPLNQRILIEPLEQQSTTTSGLYIPDKAKEQPQQGVVRAVYDECEKVAVGNIVLYEKFVGTKFRLNDIEYLVLKDDDVLGVITGGGIVR